MKWYFIPLFLLCFLVAGTAQFTDITEDAGLRHNCATNTIMGGGAAFIDYNNDGWLDLAFTGGQAPDKLYKNNGDKTFENVSHLLSRHLETDITTGVLSGDINGDGYPDLLFTTWNDDAPDFILINDGDGGFVLENENTLSERGSAMGATLYDFNRDGLLDIYIANYVAEPKFIEENSEVIGFDHTPATNYLYINEGNMVFSEQSVEYGVESQGCALAVTVIPTPDNAGRGLYLANDFGEWVHPNEFFNVQDDLPYPEVAADYGLDVGIYAMGIAVGDYNNDLNFDLYITNLGANALLVNDGQQFRDRAANLNVANEFAPDGLYTTSWGTFFFDLNNDSWQDLFVANGFINSPEFIETSFIDPNQLYLNINNGTLRDRAEALNVDNSGINRGAVSGDFDNDGDIDILTAYVNYEVSDNPDRHYKLYQNNTNNANFVDLDLVATTTASDAFGSIVEVKAGGQKTIGYKYSSGTHVSQNSPFVHMGIGESEIVDSIEIFWPSLTTTTTLTDIPANSRIRVIEGVEGYEILGCTNPNSENYNPAATLDYGCSLETVSTDDISRQQNGYLVNYEEGNLNIISKYEQPYNYYLTDINGRILKSSDRTLTGNHISSINYLPAGMYVVSIFTEDGRHSNQLVTVY